MAINLVNTFSTSDVNLTNLMSTTDKLYNVSLSLTNMNNTTVPAIAHVSTVEVNGALYQTDAETAISTTDPVTSTTVADGTVYVMLTPSVTGTTCTAAFTATAPTWSDTKQGWYGTGGFANCKYLEYIIDKSSTLYKSKFKFTNYSKFPLFLAYSTDTAQSNITSGTYTGIPGLVEKYYSLDSSVYNNSTGYFTIPYKGVWRIKLFYGFANYQVDLIINLNNDMKATENTVNRADLTFSMDKYCAKGENIYWNARRSTGNPTYITVMIEAKLLKTDI